MNLYAYCGNNPVRYYDPSGYVIKTYYENLFDRTITDDSSSSKLVYNILRQIGIADKNIPSDLKTGSHQGQHVIPQSKKDLAPIKVTGYQMDHGNNGIFASNKSQKSNNLMDFVLSQNVEQSKIDKYITNNTHHGADFVNSYDHAAYSAFVENKVNEISKKYGLPNEIKTQEKLDLVLKNLNETDIKNIRSDLTNLQENLRELHKDGIDLYIKNNYNTSEKNWFNKVKGYDANKNYTKAEYNKIKAKASRIYNKELGEKLDAKTQACINKGRR